MGVDWGIEDFIQDERYSNFMTIRISGQFDLDRAKDILGNFDFVGIVERYEESLLLMKSRIGGLNKINFEKMNVRSNRKKAARARGFDEHTLNRIREVNTLDTQLYDFAAAVLFERYKCRYQGNLTEALAEFQSNNLNFKFGWYKQLFWKMYSFLYTNNIQRIASLS